MKWKVMIERNTITKSHVIQLSFLLLNLIVIWANQVKLNQDVMYLTYLLVNLANVKGFYESFIYKKCY